MKSLNQSGGPVVIGCAALFIGAVALFIGSIIGFFIVNGIFEMHRQAVLMEGAEPVAATIVASEVVRSTHSTGTNRTGRSTQTFVTPHVTFTYVFDGRPRTSERIHPSASSADETWARRFVSRYPAGASATAWVHPDHPDDAFLERRWGYGPYLMLIAGSICLGVLMAMAALVSFLWPRVSSGAMRLGVIAWLVGPLYAGAHYWFVPRADLVDPTTDAAGAPVATWLLALITALVLITSPLP